MKTFAVIDENTGGVVGFDIDNSYISLATVVTVLSGVSGVSDVRRRRAFSGRDDIHVRFKYRGAECVVWEPFGDNSHYWIGPADVAESHDMREIERAFVEHQPVRLREIVGDVLTLRLITRFFRR